MPLIVQPEHYHWWLTSDGSFQSVLNAPDKSELHWHPVNRALNNKGVSPNFHRVLSSLKS
jgi:putative SOS response-associated peptidase YedK